jgi:hypothetical protein
MDLILPKAEGEGSLAFRPPRTRCVALMGILLDSYWTEAIKHLKRKG